MGGSRLDRGVGVRVTVSPPQGRREELGVSPNASRLGNLSTTVYRFNRSDPPSQRPPQGPVHQGAGSGSAITNRATTPEHAPAAPHL